MVLKNAQFILRTQRKRFFSTHAEPLEWPANIVRRTFLDYYQNLGCKFVPSSPVLFKQDPALIFVNAGMCQFKSIFLSSEKSPAPSNFENLKLAVNSQKCIRASGKHCDFDTIGKNGKHHTFFEMLGNWAFNGNLSKLEACEQAWRLLTEVYKLEKDRFFVTYFGGCPEQNLDPDFETRDIWLRKIGLAENRVLSLPLADNFWEMGRSGPCGPCTEIFYFNLDIADVKKTTLDQCTEVWNLVFIQYDRNSDGNLHNLPKMHLDTGMGLERLCSILQKVPSNYETDLFWPIISQIEQFSGHRFRSENFQNRSKDESIRILADHSRSCAVLLSDGVEPGPKGAGHILRRLIRNAIYQANENLSCPPKTLARLAQIFLETTMLQAFPEMLIGKSKILAILNAEEEKFVGNVEKAKKMLEKVLQIRSQALNSKDLWNMYRNNGLPKEIIQSMCQKYKVEFNDDEFELERRRHIERSKSDWDRFFVTYFGGCPEQNLDPDFETRDIWLRKIGLAENRVLSLPLADNFWEMGRSGPCGPCTEIFYFNLDIADVKKTTLDQCTEVWNLVFIQYHRDSDGNLHNLPKMHLDTGMGLERLCSILQKVPSNYETDLFWPIISQIEQFSGHRFRSENFQNRSKDESIRILADHSRSCAVLLSDGVEPGPKGAGHILRRLIRNAIYQANENLSCPPKTLARLAQIFLETTMLQAFPEMLIGKSKILAILNAEEEKFVGNVEKAKKMLEKVLQIRSQALNSKDLWNMYRNNGLPKEIIQSMCQKYKVEFNDDEFELERRRHIERSKSDWVKGMGVERLCSILQKKPSNYETDLFWPIISQIEQFSGHRFRSQNFQNRSKDESIRILADHSRSCAVLLSDGVEPGPKGAGHILRRLIRNAIYQANENLSCPPKTLARLAQIFLETTMLQAFPEMLIGKSKILAILNAEEEKFVGNVEKAKKMLEKVLQIRSQALNSKDLWNMYRNNGLPKEIIQSMCQKYKVEFNDDEFELERRRHIERSKSDWVKGMGVERLCSILQKKPSNYETDLFWPIISQIEQFSGHRFRSQNFQNRSKDESIRILADHSRSCAVLLSDGVEPGPKGAGHILRRLIRNAIYQANENLSCPPKTLARLAQIFLETTMLQAFPEMLIGKSKILAILNAEEEKFVGNVEKAKKMLEKVLQIRSQALNSKDLWNMYRNNGLPKEIIQSMCQKYKVEFNDDEFELERRRHIERSKSDWVKGMGLERLCSILQKVPSNYETDLFWPIISQIEQFSGHQFRSQNFQNRSKDESIRILADHSRSCAVLLSDGVEPGPKGAGHVLRRLIRNAIYQANENLSCPPKTLARLAQIFLETTMSQAFPEMMIGKSKILAILNAEEEKFVGNVEKAKKMLEKVLQIRSQALNSKDLFTIYRNNGLPKEIIQSMCQKYKVEFNDDEFELERRRHIERSKSDWVKGRALHIPY